MKTQAVSGFLFGVFITLYHGSSLTAAEYWNWTETGENFGFNIPVLYGLMIPQFLKNISVCDTFCQADERKALIDFYHQTKGPHWLRRKHWNTIKFHCDWEGILCYNRTQHVIAIGLLGNTGMRGEIGNTLGRLPYLLGTGMGGNGLIANITMLLNSFRPFFIRLDFASNKIYGELPNDLATKWPNLGKIQLSRNKDLYGSLPNNIDKLKNLQVLSIGQTGITGRIPLPILYQSDLRFLQMIDIRGNPAMKGEFDQTYIKIDRTLMTTEKASDNFACPAIRLKHSNCIVKTDSSYYDRRYCQCNQGYYGQGGYCQKCMKGGMCIRRKAKLLVNITSVSPIFGDYIFSEMKLRRGYWPYPSPDNVRELIKCHWTQPGRELCNPLGNVSCNLKKQNASSVTICKPEHNICAEGSNGVLCSRCKKGYFKQGLSCYPCPKKEKEDHQIITIIIGICMIIIIGGGFACYAYKLYDQNSLCQKLLAIILTILEAVTVFILGALRIIPSWLAQVNIILMLLTIGGFGIGKSFLKILVFYVQIADALISSAHIWPSFIYKFEDLLGNALNLRFSFLSCHLPRLFTPVGKLLFLMALPVFTAVVLFAFTFLTYIIKGRKDAELHSKIKNKCAQLTIMFLNLAYFPLVKTSASVLAPCRTIGDTAVMTNYVWIECSSNEHKSMLLLAGFATAFYGFGVPFLFLGLLIWKRARVAEGDAETNQWLGSLYNHYKPEYRIGMEVFLLLRRTALAFLVVCLSSHRPLQSALTSSVFIVYLAFESHAKPFIVLNPVDNPVGLKDKIRNFGLENFLEILTLIVLLVSFITVQQSLQAEHVDENVIWGIIALNALLSLILVSCVIKRMLVRRPAYGNLAEVSGKKIEA
eukprot:Seg3801.2 transcript_id=Seg3801.2/GoldUCD/mRNA.D3Y31 product="putative leucine-rich repeat-containing protein" protein_id=Seg3801.2/GoldUCD/D3Y31